MAWPATKEELPGGLENQTNAESGLPDPATYAALGGTDPEGEGDHAARHNDLADAQNRTWAELGLNPSGAEADVAARLAAMDLVLAGDGVDIAAAQAAIVAEETRAKNAEAALKTARELGDATTLGEALALVNAEAATRSAADATKAAAVHTHAQSDVTGLVAALEGKQGASATLAALSALTTTALGRSLLEKATSAALREALELTGPTFTAALTANAAGISAQTEPQSIAGLALPIGSSATEIWKVKLFLLLASGNNTMDAKFGFTTTATGATMQWAAQRGGTGAGTALPFIGATITSDSPGQTARGFGEFVSTGTGNFPMILVVEGIVFGAGTAGSVQAKIAQNTSDATALVVGKGSHIEAVRLAA